ncbi:MAG TPA: hypothetical protein PLD62_08685, partial [Candidatus Cloacimonadota bacterium]|nr:hypothetical protein [Candidatus Cloacimonadota bacterium]
SEAVALIEITKSNGQTTSKKIKEFFQDNITLEYAPEIIVSSIRTYFLRYPLRCLFEKEENYFVIQSEMLNIIGTGLTKEDAEISFSEEFDYIYKRYNSLDNTKLTTNNVLIKSILNQIVDRFE